MDVSRFTYVDVCHHEGLHHHIVVQHFQQRIIPEDAL